MHADRKGATYLVNNCRKTVTQTKSNGGQQVVFGPCGKYIIGVLWPEPYKLIYSPSLLTRFGCQAKIIEDTNASSSPLMDAFRSIFDDPNSVYSVLCTNNTITGQRVAQTIALQPHTNAAGIVTHKYEISFKESYLSTATDLSIAAFTIHENLHAILLYLMQNNVITTPYTNPTHNQLLEAYANKLVQLGRLPATNNAYHEFMAQLTGDITPVLKAYGIAKAIPCQTSFIMIWRGAS